MAAKPKPKPKAKIGAPTKRTAKIVGDVLAAISSGTPLTVVCRSVGIDQSTFMRWTYGDAVLAALYESARDLGFDAIALEALAIADDKTRDTIKGPRGEPALDREWVERSKLRVHTRMQLLAKWDPKRYGEKLQHTGDGGGPVKLNVTSEDAQL